MKEITRIHIAKTPYDIEVSAKKELETYFKQLEAFAGGQDWIEDIEIRTTELLLERGISKNGLITGDDVESIESQLGSAEDFTDNPDELSMIDEDKQVTRRLYRHLDDALIGGVLSGIAKFFGINPLWVRLVFLVLFLGSYGTVTVVYLVMWLSIPAAKTAAEKLQLEGKPVTLASIKSIRERTGEINVSRIASIAQSIIIYGSAALFTLSALCSLMATVWGGVLLASAYGDPNNPIANLEFLGSSWGFWIPYILFILSGLLLTTLLSLVSSALIRKKLSRRVGIAIIVVTLAGAASFGAGLTGILYGSWQQSNLIAESRSTKTTTLPSEFTDVEKLIIQGVDSSGHNYSSVSIEYVVDTDQPRYETTTDIATLNASPTFSYSDDGKTATLNMKVDEGEKKISHNYPEIKVYGPTLKEIKSTNSTVTYNNKASQDSLKVVAESAYVDVSGVYEKVRATSDNSSNVTLSGASIEALEANVENGRLVAGVVRSLKATQPDVCPSNTFSRESSMIEVQAVTSGEMSYNGKKQPAKDIESLCGELDIEDSHSDDTVED